jgi:hypothetical protein
MDFLKTPARARRRALAGAVALALVATAASAEARRLDVAAPQNWKPGDGTAVSAIFGALRAVPPRQRPAGTAVVTTPVTSCADDGSAGTLRSVVTGANDGDTIDLRGLACGPLKLTQGAIPVYVNTLTLIGDGADETVIDGNAADRVFLHYGYYALNLRNLTVSNGSNQVSGYKIAGGACILSNAYVTLDHASVRDCKAIGEGAYGGAILSPGLLMYTSTLSGNTAIGSAIPTLTASYGGGAFAYRGTAVLYDSTVSGNRAVGDPGHAFGTYDTGAGIFTDNGGYFGRSTISGNYTDGTGGGVATHGPLLVVDSTISGNTAKLKSGGGLFARLNGDLVIASSTIADNTAPKGGGVYVARPAAGDIVLQSSIIAGNRLNDVALAYAGTISGANNLVVTSSNATLPADTLNEDPHLLPLASNGGPTQTHALPIGSIAIDRGNNIGALAIDQRGEPRVVGTAADIGAYERAAVPIVTPIAVPTLSRWGALGGCVLLALAGARRRRRS